MASDRSSETRKMAVTTANSVENFGATLKGIAIVADTDCYIDFDQPTDTGSLLIKANLEPAYLPVPCQYVYARAVTGSGNIYLLGIR